MKREFHVRFYESLTGRIQWATQLLPVIFYQSSVLLSGVFESLTASIELVVMEKFSMLILPNSCFLHVPKTGGSWVKKAIIASGIKYEDYRIDGDPHIGLNECPVANRFMFAFIRHPVDLYRSYWQFKMTYEWDVKNQLDMDCKSHDFNDFIRNVLNKYPRCYGDSLINFVGDKENEIDFVGKHENLIEDLISALKYAKEEFSEDAIRNLSPYNVSDKTRFPANYTKELEEEVKRIEINVMERFGYN